MTKNRSGGKRVTNSQSRRSNQIDKQKRKTATARWEGAQQQKYAQEVHVAELTREGPPAEKVVIHYGPTNSGKTYESRQRLLERFDAGEFTSPRSAIYAAPLRMLAQENYDYIASIVGYENVGLMTGEESINDQASIICMTCEMVPQEGVLLIIDEAHWITNNNRGQVWTRAIATSSFQEVHIISAEEAAPVIEPLVADALEITTIRHQRFNELVYDGSVGLEDIPERSAVVGFSKLIVHMVAQRLIAQGKKVSVLYGNLPPNSRREQIDRFISGETDYVIATDVIGHGVNLPVENVVFAGIDKFDGVSRRPLMTWEIAQIAGRAGRHDSLPGKVYALSGIKQMEIDETLLKRGVAVANGLERSDLDASKTYVSPLFSSLGKVNESSELFGRLQAWAKMVKVNGDVTPIDLSRHVKKLELIENEMRIRTGARGREGRFSGTSDAQVISTIWRLLSIHIEANSEVFLPLAVAVINDYDNGFQSLVAQVTDLTGDIKLHNLEQGSKTVRELMMVRKEFPHLRMPSEETLSYVSDSYSTEIDLKIIDSIANTAYGHCKKKDCGSDCAPWLDYCTDRCRKDAENAQARTESVRMYSTSTT